MKAQSIAVLMVGLLPAIVWAQGTNPCDPYPLVTYELPRPVERLPISIYMPYDVLLGYIALDTFQYHAPTVSPDAEQQTIEFLQRQRSWNDTLRKIARVWYAMADYDPTLFEARLRRWRTLEPSPVVWREILEENVRAASSSVPEARLDYSLLSSHYILHVKVVDTLHARRSPPIPSMRNFMEVNVTCVVKDVIKGRVAPLCDPAFQRGWLSNSSRALDSGRCLQFVYSPFRIREFTADVIEYQTDSLGNWVRPELLGHIFVPGCEYIVFLRYSIECQQVRDSIRVNYYRLRPLRNVWGTAQQSSCGFGIYPIVDGIVEDPADDFGFGSGLTVEQFKQRLRARIEEIRNW